MRFRELVAEMVAADRELLREQRRGESHRQLGRQYEHEYPHQKLGQYQTQTTRGPESLQSS